MNTNNDIPMSDQLRPKKHENQRSSPNNLRYNNVYPTRPISTICNTYNVHVDNSHRPHLCRVFWTPLALTFDWAQSLPSPNPGQCPRELASPCDILPHGVLSPGSDTNNSRNMINWGNLLNIVTDILNKRFYFLCVLSLLLLLLLFLPHITRQYYRGFIKRVLPCPLYMPTHMHTIACA